MSDIDGNIPSRRVPQKAPLRLNIGLFKILRRHRSFTDEELSATSNLGEIAIAIGILYLLLSAVLNSKSDY